MGRLSAAFDLTPSPPPHPDSFALWFLIFLLLFLLSKSGTHASLWHRRNHASWCVNLALESLVHPLPRTTNEALKFSFLTVSASSGPASRDKASALEKDACERSALQTGRGARGDDVFRLSDCHSDQNAFAAAGWCRPGVRGDGRAACQCAVCTRLRLR